MRFHSLGRTQFLSELNLPSEPARRAWLTAPRALPLPEKCTRLLSEERLRVGWEAAGVPAGLTAGGAGSQKVVPTTRFGHPFARRGSGHERTGPGGRVHAFSHDGGA